MHVFDEGILNANSFMLSKNQIKITVWQKKL